MLFSIDCCYCGGDLCEQSDDRGTRWICMRCSAIQPEESRTDWIFGLAILFALGMVLASVLYFWEQKWDQTSDVKNAAVRSSYDTTVGARGKSASGAGISKTRSKAGAPSSGQ